MGDSRVGGGGDGDGMGDSGGRGDQISGGVRPPPPPRDESPAQISKCIQNVPSPSPPEKMFAMTLFVPAGVKNNLRKLATMLKNGRPAERGTKIVDFRLISGHL